MAFESTELENEIRKLLDEKLCQGVLSGEDCLHILLELAKAKDEEALKEAVKGIAKKFPFFEEVILLEAQKKQESLHDIVHGFVEQLIKKDPVKAAEISKMALKKETTLEQLFEFSPEFKQFYEKKTQ